MELLSLLSTASAIIVHKRTSRLSCLVSRTQIYSMPLLKLVQRWYLVNGIDSLART